MMVTNEVFSDTYNRFLKLKTEFKSYALEHARYSETYEAVDELGHRKLSKRRPIVVIDDNRKTRTVERMLKEWHEIRDTLHEMSPERFPLNSGIFNPEPLILKDVISVSIYLNGATRSQQKKASNLIQRVNVALSRYKAKPEKAVYKEQIQALEQDLALLESDPEATYRLRADGYTEVVAIVKFKDSMEEKFKVSEAGLFLVSPLNHRDPIFVRTPPEQSNKAGRRSIYDSIPEVKISLPLAGKLYKEPKKNV
ncbi:hypothetical protein L4174_024020 (plasmid) [Photobacterium sp. CCB-ST2H9]|uniref:hypothetical protein n=1 Tax=Photobacterium sp. CCB-ST2H9 TaxID=2912855 RepID=UPI002003DB4B|nr:hypothetical protein [Photobacterium sp. CCB-ST2H9]UTM60454.1 hypothetical protein L4174_024020 [Photobacterium sp. CCB-ST2H9]